MTVPATVSHCRQAPIVRRQVPRLASTTGTDLSPSGHYLHPKIPEREQVSVIGRRGPGRDRQMAVPMVTSDSVRDGSTSEII